MNKPMIAVVIPFLLFILGCASPRTSSLIPIKFSEQAPRLLMYADCNDKKISIQGIVVCEQKYPSTAHVTVKVPPIEGRVVYSNGELKRTEDFNWYPKEGFWLWKKKPIKDTWAELDLGEINAAFGDWPVAIDVMGVSSVGVINTRGILYYRICNDTDIPCSRLVVEYPCAGLVKATGESSIGKCDRLAGSPQSFTVKLKTEKYSAKNAKLYVSAPRTGFIQTVAIQKGDEEKGEIKFDLPPLPSGPTMVGFRLAWYDGQELKHLETRILIHGSNPDWTPMDDPHALQHGSTVDFVKPVLSDLMETNLYGASGTLLKKNYTTDKVLSGFPLPSSETGLSCAYAWSRDSSDSSVSCLNSKGEPALGVNWNE